MGPTELTRYMAAQAAILMAARLFKIYSWALMVAIQGGGTPKNCAEIIMAIHVPYGMPVLLVVRAAALFCLLRKPSLLQVRFLQMEIRMLRLLAPKCVVVEAREEVYESRQLISLP